MKNLWSDFVDFLKKGDLVALATAVVIATCFGNLVKALIADLITPVIAVVAGKPNFGDLSFTIHHSHFGYGNFINAGFTFVTTAAAVFFLVIKPYQHFTHHDPTTTKCPECLFDIPLGATRCGHCSAEIASDPVDSVDLVKV